MAVFRGKGTKKPSGGRIRRYRKKKKTELGGYSALTKIGKLRRKFVKVRGGNLKIKVLSIDEINLYDPKEKKYSKVKIKSVLENPANRHFVRRNIITKGTIIDTEKGKAKVVSRPGQTGVLNAVLVKEWFFMTFYCLDCLRILSMHNIAKGLNMGKFYIGIFKLYFSFFGGEDGRLF